MIKEGANGTLSKKCHVSINLKEEKTLIEEINM